MSANTPTRTLWSGRYLSVHARGDWEFATRHTRRPAVGIVAVTEENQVVLVEQFRPAIDSSVVELPAGLAGDIAGQQDEPLVAAAQRELLEETGYTAGRWTELVHGYSSPGLTDEAIVLFLAEQLSKAEAGGGDSTENITIHLVPMDGVLDWLAQRNRRADIKLLAGLHAAQAQRLRQRVRTTSS